MIYIMILIGHFGYGNFAIAPEFNSQVACEAARDAAIKESYYKFEVAMCVPKGDRG